MHAGHANIRATLRTHARLAGTQPERNLADDVIADFEAGLEYASARRILDRRRAAVTEYLVEARGFSHVFVDPHTDSLLLSP